MQRLGRYGWHTASPNPRRHHVLDREDLESTHGVVVSSDLGCQGVLPWLFFNSPRTRVHWLRVSATG